MNPSTGSKGFPKSIRIRKRAGYLDMKRRGRAVKSGCLVLLWRPNRTGADRIGITVSRRVGPAVTRNRVKRLIREAFRLLPKSPPGLDLVVIARPRAAGADFAAVNRQLAGLITSARDQARTGG